MSEVGRIADRAIRRELANVEDNLYRYRHFADPDGTTGNGEPIRDENTAAYPSPRPVYSLPTPDDVRQGNWGRWFRVPRV